MWFKRWSSYLGKVWEDVWRGPCVIINAGCFTTRTIIPKGVFPLFITMEKDYFKSVNTYEKVVKLFYNYVEDPGQKGVFIHLLGEEHMPDLNRTKELFNKCFDFLLGNNLLDVAVPKILIRRNYYGFPNHTLAKNSVLFAPPGRHIIKSRHWFSFTPLHKIHC